MEKEKAMKEDKSQPFIDDIDEEIELYKNRENIIREVRKMMKAAKDAGVCLLFLIFFLRLSIWFSDKHL